MNNNDNIGIYVQDTAGLSTITGNILTNNINYNMYLYDSLTNESFQLGFNQFIGSDIGLAVQGNTTTGPIVTMNQDAFIGTDTYYIFEMLHQIIYGLPLQQSLLTVGIWTYHFS